MTTTTIDTHTERQTYVLTAGIAMVWIAAALVRPETTFHLGPIILPFVPFIVAPKAARVRAVGLALAMGAGVIALLSLTGNLSGPSFEPFPSAFAESVVALAASGGLALGLARFTR